MILASASPRRRELLKLICNEFKIIPSDIEEKVPNGLSAAEIPDFLARQKALDIAKSHPCDTVIGADTVVILDGTVIGKPHNSAEAAKILKALSGKTHSVVTGCAVCKGEVCRSFSEKTDVTFYTLGENEIEQYIKTGEPYDKAGAYGIQGGGSLFVKSIRGDYYNVVGLPIARLSRFMQTF